jgi:EAL domain-containing protein (putative c-di-GMP-specific phosphodiesterase class I)
VLARHGAQLGIEHFGRQLAALPRLYALRLAYLKLDGSFVAGLDDNAGHQRLVKAIVDVARGLGWWCMPSRCTAPPSGPPR